MRILGTINVCGNSAGLRPLVGAAAIPNGIYSAVGLKRRIPDVDRWSYKSPLYRFRFDSLDAEVRSFLLAHNAIGPILNADRSGIEFAYFTFCPVAESEDEWFSGYLQSPTLMVLGNLGLGLEIAPESLMPEASYWIADDLR
ncbi:MAG TPA: hypothetical protein VGI20_03855 [Rhizomicrobium sp.]